MSQIRTLNFTGRMRILREEALITLQTEPSGAVAFDAKLDLGRLALPGDAKVYIEAAFKTTFMRFEWGTVTQPAPAEDRRLTLLEQPRLTHFRVKVVQSAATGLGRLLAVADRIAPEGLQDGEKRNVSLFRVNYTKLDHEIWQLGFDDAGPVLELQNMTGIKEIVRQEAFMALVFPELIRQVFKQIFADGIDDVTADPLSWQARWLKFGEQQARKRLPSLGNDEPDAIHEDWIDDVLKNFGKRLKLVAKFKKRFAGSEAELP